MLAVFYAVKSICKEFRTKLNIIPSIDTPPLIVLLFGLVFAISMWIFAIRIVK